jgi:hypothetical protein
VKAKFLIIFALVFSMSMAPVARADHAAPSDSTFSEDIAELGLAAIVLGIVLSLGFKSSSKTVALTQLDQWLNKQLKALGIPNPENEKDIQKKIEMLRELNTASISQNNYKVIPASADSADSANSLRNPIIRPL